MMMGEGVFGKLAAPFRKSVAWKLAIIAIGPIVGLALGIFAEQYTESLRLESETLTRVVHEEQVQAEMISSTMGIVGSQLSGYLDSRTDVVEREVMIGLSDTQKAIDRLKASEDASIRKWVGASDDLLVKLKKAFEDLKEQVLKVGRTSSEGLTDDLDTLTELLVSMFAGVTAAGDEFRPIVASYMELYGIELRYRWKRDSRIEAHIATRRDVLLNQLSKVKIAEDQVESLTSMVQRQKEAHENWRDGVSAERKQRDAAADLTKRLVAEASTIRDRTESRQLDARAMATKANELAGLLSQVSHILAALISIGMIYLIGRTLGKSLLRLARSMQSVARGEAGISVPFTGRHDEIGDMGRALQVFQASIAERAELALQAEEGAKLRQQRGEQVEGAVRNFASEVESALGQLRGSADKMREASSGLERNSDDLAQHAEVASRSTATASSEVSSVAVAAEQLAKSVDEVSRQAVRSTQVAGNAVEQSRQASGMMNDLVLEARRIGDVVELIRSIAGQTNLLALNATIEAARAGEAGRGFAVVASEVKALATQTAKATEDIVERISAIQASSEHVGTAINDIGSILSEMSGIATSVAAAVEEQSSAIATISDNVNEAARSSAEGADAIQNAGARVTASKETAGIIALVAQGVAQESARLETVVSSFLGDVRAA